MTNLEVRTKLGQEEVVELLKKYFGKGLGLQICQEMPQCLSFEGGGGYVTTTICPEEDKTVINLVTQEWDYQVKEFVSGLL